MYHYSTPHNVEFSHNVTFESSAKIASPNPRHVKKKEPPRNFRLVTLVPILVILVILVKNYTGTKDDHNSVLKNDEKSELPFPSISPFNEQPQLRPLVISGPSGVGKGTLINMLVEFYNQEYEESDILKNEDHHPLSFSVSHTTSKC